MAEPSTSTAALLIPIIEPWRSELMESKSASDVVIKDPSASGAEIVTVISAESVNSPSLMV